jgi:hypothetical protein
LSDLSWSNYAASFCCLLSAFFILKEYREQKKVFDEGIVTVGIIQKCNCTYSSRIKSTVDIKIKEENESVILNVGSDFCFESVIGDSISVRYSNRDSPILKFNSELKTFPKYKIYFSVFCFLLAIFFLLVREEPLEYIPKKKLYKKGKKHKK